MKIWRALLRG